MILGNLSSMRHIAGFFVCITLTTHLVQCQSQQQQAVPQQGGHTYATSRASRNGVASRYNRTSAAPAPQICEYKELMVNLHDRVSVLASLDQDQRNRLADIDKKIVQFEESNLARLDSIVVQQLDVNKRLDVIEHLQRMNNRQVEAFKEEFIQFQQQQQKQLENVAGQVNEIGVTRVTRQSNNTGYTDPNALPNSYNMRSDCSVKLDSLATLLASTRFAVNNLETQVADNLPQLLQTTSNLQRRFNNFGRRQQAQVGFQNFLPQPANFLCAAANDERSLETICTMSRPEDSLGTKKIQLTAYSTPFYVACDDKIQGGGWTVIQSRFSGDINFNRDWSEYKTGFGNIAGEYFIGLEKLHALTSSSLHELIILMTDFQKNQRFARYSTFAIGSEKEFYPLNLLGPYTGDAGDAFSYQAGSKFSTFDNDNDGWVEGNCALAHTGAWWYNACEKSNLNGQYLNGEHDEGQNFQGMYWQDFRGSNYSLKSVRMMIRPVCGEQEQSR